MDIKLQQECDQLLAEIREYALGHISTVLEDSHILKALMCCMLSQWLNEMIDEK